MVDATKNYGPSEHMATDSRTVAQMWTLIFSSSKTVTHQQIYSNIEPYGFQRSRSLGGGGQDQRLVFLLLDPVASGLMPAIPNFSEDILMLPKVFDTTDGLSVDISGLIMLI